MTDPGNILELFFSQSLDGFFFMMLDEPIRWDDTVDKEAVLNYVFEHQRITKINDAMLQQYGATKEQFLGLTPVGLFAHDVAHGRDLWRRMFDAGRLHVESDERRFDGTPICIDGDYICFFDAEERITGHFGIQRDVTERMRYSKRLRLLQQMDRAILSARSVEDTISVALDHMRDLVPGCRVAVRAVGSTTGKETTPSSVSIPLRSGGELIGTLDLDSDQPEGFTAEHIEIAHEVADSLAVAMRHAQMNEQLQGQNVYLLEELEREWNFQEIVGASPAMQNVFRAVEIVATTDSTVLLLGETGTGKELIARALHNRSSRKSKVMMKVNCAALPASLIESELFGHEKGAFTGAIGQKKGRFELADGGTIFLDEIGEMPLEAQTKLLRALQEQEFERIGGSRTVKVNVRVIAATNRDLGREVRQGTFRSDLFYRLNVFPITVPPLRDRRDDIPLLTRHFVRLFADRMGKRIRSINPGTHRRLQNYDWPGNVRELANILERAVIICQEATLQEEHVAFEKEHTDSAVSSFPTLEESERRLIQQAIDRTGGILGGPHGAARLLGMNRSTLWSRMRKLGLGQNPPL
ncbi:MAG TPA: sigma 54-interacting transcriptional regulator [Terriglobia bacterium]|nr:sigma 54-interacting transcriptional regulator [Terriglobia bacterium]